MIGEFLRLWVHCREQLCFDLNERWWVEQLLTFLRFLNERFIEKRSEIYKSARRSSLSDSYGIYRWRESFSFPRWNRCYSCSTGSAVRSDAKCRVGSSARFQDRTALVVSTERSVALGVPKQRLSTGGFKSTTTSLTSINGISRTSKIIWWISCKLCWTNKGTGLQQARTPWGSLQRYV